MLDDGAIRFDDLDDTIVGTDQRGLIVYDYIQMVVFFMKRDGMTMYEAIEFVDFNVVGVNAGNGFTILHRNKEEVLGELKDE